MQNFINYCYDRAKTILTEHKAQLELIAKTLLEVETLDAKQIKSLFEDGKLPEPEEGSDDLKVSIQSKEDDEEKEDFLLKKQKKKPKRNPILI